MLIKDKNQRIKMTQILENRWLFPLSQEEIHDTIEINEEEY